MSTTSQPPRIACPHCQGQIKAPSLAPGSMVTCPKCGKAFALGGRPEGTGDRGQETTVSAGNPQSAIRNPQSPARPLPRAHAGTRGVVTPPSVPEPVAEAAPGDLVPLDAGTAAAATQPAHQPPRPMAGDTIDPLML